MVLPTGQASGSSVVDSLAWSRARERRSSQCGALAETSGETGEVRGVEPSAIFRDRTGKLGLAGMKERCELVGGSFEVRSDHQQGTRILVTVASSQRDR